jgi:CelD/BcsL family acetyltransferase involved in cellulose biosynthesis
VAEGFEVTGLPAPAVPADIVAPGQSTVEPRRAGLNSHTRVESWRSRGLDGIAAEWRDLLSRSRADPLFNAPEWQYAWWRQFQPALRAELEILAAVDGERLIGLALLYDRRITHRWGLEGRRIELLGTAWRSRGVSFSERLGFILDSDRADEAAAALAAALEADASWDDFVVAHTHRGGATERAVRELAARCGGYLREPDVLEAWEVPLEGRFDEFIGSLGPGTRARIMGSRCRLEKAGVVRERVLGADELDYGWEIFARLHMARWDRPFSAYWREFYGTIAAAQARLGVPVMSLLEFNGAPVSALVNFRAGGREYSMVSAFVPVGVKRVSPGWLHLGLAIERAFADGMTHFDLLGGEGKNEQYKAAFGGRRNELVCMHYVRRPGLALMYRAWDAAKRMGKRLRRRAT